MVSRLTVFSAVAIVVLVAGSGRSSAAQAPASQSDVLSALLVEVRGLRSAMEQMATAGPLVQLAFGRLQLQEQRINTMLRRHELVRDQLAAAARAEEDARSDTKRFEEAVRTRANADERADLEAQLDRRKRDAARLGANLQQLQNEESTLASQIAAEQTRWTELGQRLDELERSLARR